MRNGAFEEVLGPDPPPKSSLRPLAPPEQTMAGDPYISAPTPSTSPEQPPEPTLSPLILLTSPGPFADAFTNIRRTLTLSHNDRQTFSVTLMNLRNPAAAELISTLSPHELHTLAALIRVAAARIAGLEEHQIEEYDPAVFSGFMAKYPLTDHLSLPPPPPPLEPITDPEELGLDKEDFEEGEFIAYRKLPTATHRDNSCILTGRHVWLYPCHILPPSLVGCPNPHDDPALYFLGLVIGREPLEHVWNLINHFPGNPRNTLLLSEWFHAGWESGMVELQFVPELSFENVMVLELQTRHRRVEWPWVSAIDEETWEIVWRPGVTGDKFVVHSKDMKKLPLPSPGLLKVRTVVRDLCGELGYYKGGTYARARVSGGGKPVARGGDIGEEEKEEAKEEEEELVRSDDEGV